MLRSWILKDDRDEGKKLSFICNIDEYPITIVIKKAIFVCTYGWPYKLLGLYIIKISNI